MCKQTIYQYTCSHSYKQPLKKCKNPKPGFFNLHTTVKNYKKMAQTCYLCPQLLLVPPYGDSQPQPLQVLYHPPPQQLPVQYQSYQQATQMQPYQPLSVPINTPISLRLEMVGGKWQNVTHYGYPTNTSGSQNIPYYIQQPRVNHVFIPPYSVGFNVSAGYPTPPASPQATYTPPPAYTSQVPPIPTAQVQTQGYNPFHGFDTGAPPPSYPPAPPPAPAPSINSSNHAVANAISTATGGDWNANRGGDRSVIVNAANSVGDSPAATSPSRDANTANIPSSSSDNAEDADTFMKTRNGTENGHRNPSETNCENQQTSTANKQPNSPPQTPKAGILKNRTGGSPPGGAGDGGDGGRKKVSFTEPISEGEEEDVEIIKNVKKRDEDGNGNGEGSLLT